MEFGVRQDSAGGIASQCRVCSWEGGKPDVLFLSSHRCGEVQPDWSNQSILKEISPGISLEGMMLKLKFQYFGHLMRRVDSLEKTLMLGGIGGRRRRG